MIKSAIVKIEIIPSFLLILTFLEKSYSILPAHINFFREVQSKFALSTMHQN